MFFTRSALLQTLLLSATFLSAACASTSSKEAAPHGEATKGSSTAKVEPQDSPAHAPLLPGTWTTTILDEQVTVHSLVSPEEALAVTSHVIETSGHVFVVDTQLTLPHTAQLMAKVRELSKPVAKVMVTHGHPDHYFGVGQIRTLGVDVEALPSTRSHIKQRFKSHQAGHKKMEGDAIPEVIEVPNVDLVPGVFTVDGVELFIEEVHHAEDVEQVIVWLPKQKALIAQDLVSNGYHAFFGTGPVDAWQQTLRDLYGREPRVVFAGHGAPGDASLLTSTSDYLEKTKQLVAAATSQEQLTQEVLAAFPERKGPFLVEVSALIVFRDRARANKK